MFYYRPRMYLFTYAFDSDDTRELYGEYHLGRQALRFVLLVMSIPYSKEVTWNVFLINKVRYVFWLNIVICRQHVGAGLWDDRLQQGFVKGEVFCFRYCYFYFQHGESTSTASHQTSIASQLSKDLNEVPLLTKSWVTPPHRLGRIKYVYKDQKLM